MANFGNLKLEVGDNGSTSQIFEKASEAVEMLVRVKEIIEEIKKIPIEITFNGEVFTFDLDGEEE